MERISCGSCGKRYDPAVEEFCPRCGAFNRPPQREAAPKAEPAPPAPEEQKPRRRKHTRADLEEGGVMLGLEVAADLAVDLLGDAISDLF